MCTPGLVCQMFCTSVAPVAFAQIPQETDAARDDQPPRGMAGTGNGAMEEPEVIVLGVLHVCLFFTSRGQPAPSCAFYASCASYVLCLHILFGVET